MRGGTKYGFVGELPLTTVPKINDLWGGPKDIELYNAAAAAWVPGSWYMIDLATGSVDTNFGLPAAAIIASSAGQELVCGIALTATAQNGKGLIRVFGKYSGANVTTGAAAGRALTISGTGASGRAVVVPANGGSGAFPIICGFALTTAASNLGDVFVCTPWSPIG